MNTKNKLYKCYKDGCSFRHDHPDGPYLTQIEYDDLLENGQIRRCPNDGYGEPCGIRELDPQDYPKPAKNPIDKKKALIFGSAALVVLFAIAAVFLFTGKKDTPKQPQEPEPTVQTTPQEQPQAPTEPEQKVETVKSEPAETKTEIKKPEGKKETVTVPPPTSGKQSFTFPDGSKYVGEMKNGKMHGLGTYTYGERQLISPKDLKKRYAEAGYYLIGEFYEGNVVNGKLFDKDNNQKEVIIIGR